MFVAIRRRVEMELIIRKVTATATAFFTDSSEMRLPNRVGLFLLRIVANAEQARIAIVTVFIPPAVPTGEPPMSIKIIHTVAEAFVKFSCGTEAKPAVLVVTDWKNDT